MNILIKGIVLSLVFLGLLVFVFNTSGCAGRLVRIYVICASDGERKEIEAAVKEEVESAVFERGYYVTNFILSYVSLVRPRELFVYCRYLEKYSIHEHAVYIALTMILAIVQNNANADSGILETQQPSAPLFVSEDPKTKYVKLRVAIKYAVTEQLDEILP